MADRREFEIGGKLLSTLRVVDLKLELEKRGLSKSGSKKELADRLKVQLRLEKLQEDASTDEGHVPNLRLQDDEIAEQNDLIKDYLSKQQQTYEMQKEARRRVELEEQRVRDSSEASAEDTSQGEEEPELKPPDVEEDRKEPSKVPDFPAEDAPVVKEPTTDKKKPAKESKLSTVEPETILPSVVIESSNDEASMEAMDLSKSDDSRQQELSKNVVEEEQHEKPEEQAKINEEEPKPDEQSNKSQSDEPSTESVDTEVQNAETDQKTEQEDDKEAEPKLAEVECVKEDVIEEVKNSQEVSQPVEQVQIVPAEPDHGSSPEAVDMSKEEVPAKETTVKEAGDGRRSSRSPSRDSQASETRRRRSRRSSSSSRSSTSSRSRSSDSQSSDSRSRSHKRGESKRSEAFHEAEHVEDSASQSSVRQELEVKVDASEDKMMDVEESSSTVDEVSNRETTKVSGKPDESTPTPDVVVKVSTRKISLSSLKESQTSEEGKENHETGEFQAPRKRKWGNSGATTAVVGKKVSLSISTDSLKGLIPELKPLSSVNTVSTESSALPVEPSETKPVPVIKPPPPPVTPTTKREIIVFHSNDQPEKENIEKVEPPVKVTRTLGRRISVNANAELVPNKITPSPARHPPTRIIHMRNLVRPFTLNQLKELLSKTGSLVEGGFWIDKIKSKCYVTYENEDQAISTRQALHGTQWPSSNPKILSVDFATQDELDFHRSLAEASELKRVPPTVENQVPNEGPIRPKPLSPRARGAKPSIDEEKPAEKARRDSHRAVDRENKEKERVVEKDKRVDRNRNQQVTELNNNTERGRVGLGGRRDREVDQRARGKDKGRQPPIREWDRDKIGERSPGERDRARVAHNRNRSRSRSRSRGVRSPLGRRDRNRDPENRDRNDRRREEEAPAKLLDDLFRKTKTAPCIYWLPLTVEQIHMKEEQRKQRQVEREKRRQQHDQTTDNVKTISQRSRSRDKEENRNWRKSKSPAKSRARRR